MEQPFSERIRRAWNAFLNRAPTDYYRDDNGSVSYVRPDRVKFTRGIDRTIVNSIYNRIAVDAASISIEHVKLDDNNRYLETVDSGLNQCLTVSANVDQTGRAFLQDVYMSILDEGCVAIVPIDTYQNPFTTQSYDILSLRVGKIVEWHPRYVVVDVYNDRTGKREKLYMPKDLVAIVENPFRSIMNEPNSTMQRLIRKLSLMDIIDEQSSAAKLDLIIQLPYVIKSDARRAEAEKRRSEIENQLANSKYGIAYADGTERIVQLNRPVENNLMAQVEYLTRMLYSQLGISEELLNGSADSKLQLAYNNRIIEPLVSAVADEMKVKFLTKTARTQRQSIMFFKDPFRMVPVDQIPEMADKLTRNEIMTSNEIRTVIGLKPAKDPSADELRNKNLNESSDEIKSKMSSLNQPNDEEQNQNGKV